MRTLLVSDIFGKTSSIKALAEAISEKAKIINPYAGEEISFADETEAYAYFMKNVGLERYCQIVNRHVTSISQPTEFIGFSVGASAVWILSDLNMHSFTNSFAYLFPSRLTGAICFGMEGDASHSTV